MLLNFETCLLGKKCVLVPYREEHVSRYHEWMKDPFLLEATGSEPLSLEEEIKMQQTWKDDEDKCTFIILARDLCDPDSFPEDMCTNTDCEATGKSVGATFISKNLDAMIGDVNLFFSDDDDEVDESGERENHPGKGDDADKGEIEGKMSRRQAELDVMVAEASCRGKGVGKEAACMMILYAAEKLQISKFVVKINENNAASRYLFEKSLGFKETNYAACFQQYEYEFKRDNAVAAISAIKAIYDPDLQNWHVPL